MKYGKSKVLSEKRNIQEAYLQKTSISVQIVSEILASPKTQRTFEKVTQRIKAILLRNTQQGQTVFVQHFVTLNSSKTVRKERSLVKCFSTLEEKFRVSARPRNILYFTFLE